MTSQEVVPPEFLDLKTSRSLTRKVLWKLDIHILPALAFVRTPFISRYLSLCLIPLRQLWLASFIDRANVGNARYLGVAWKVCLAYS